MCGLRGLPIPSEAQLWLGGLHRGCNFAVQGLMIGSRIDYAVERPAWLIQALRSMQQIGTVEEDGKVTINESSYEFLPSKRKKHTSLTPSCMTSSFVLNFRIPYLGLMGFLVAPSTGSSFALSGFPSK